MYQGHSISVVIPAYNEELGIAETIQSFQKPYIDELIVIDNNSQDRTAEIAKSLGATVIREPQQGYGYAVRRALSKASGEYVILTEADTTFKGFDMPKLLKYAEDYDMVIGTRTTTPYLAPEANMGLFLVAGNILR